MNVLITGANGFLGKGMVEQFEKYDDYKLRLMDIIPSESVHEVYVGDVSIYEQCYDALDGIDGIIIGHMAPRGENDINYSTPEMAFDVNVKGTANLFHAAVQRGIKKIVVISSEATLGAYKKSDQVHTLRAKPLAGYYGLSKGCQELMAEHFAGEFDDLQIACLRVGYILDGENNLDKYGRHIGVRNLGNTDRRDIGEVARLSLESDKLKFEIFHVMSTKESLERWDVQYTCDFLNWKAQYDFSWLPRAEINDF